MLSAFVPATRRAPSKKGSRREPSHVYEEGSSASNLQQGDAPNLRAARRYSMELTSFCTPLLRLAAWFLWMTPLAAAWSSFL